MFHRAHNGRKFERPAQGAEQIRYQHVSKAFGGKSVFEDLSLSVAEGETLTVIGGSGAGKSVLLKCLVGLMYPDDGQVIFEGQVVSDFDEAEFIEVRRRIAMVFQGSALFDSLTVGENIAFPLREHFPKMPQEEILWDEPTTGLDPVSTEIIDKLIISMKEKLGCTSIVVTHDMDSAFAVSDRIAMLAKKKIVQIGTVEEMKNSQVPEVRAFFDARLEIARGLIGAK